MSVSKIITFKRKEDQDEYEHHLLHVNDPHDSYGITEDDYLPNSWIVALGAMLDFYEENFDSLEKDDKKLARKTIKEIRLHLIDAGMYTIMTEEQIKDVVTNKGSAWDFVIDGIKYESDNTKYHEITTAHWEEIEILRPDLHND